MGVVGTGKIGQAFIKICRGFGMNVIAYDPYPVELTGKEYVSFEDLCSRADMISLHCPLTRESYHLIDENAIEKMKEALKNIAETTIYNLIRYFEGKDLENEVSYKGGK